LHVPSFVEICPTVKRCGRKGGRKGDRGTPYLSLSYPILSMVLDRSFEVEFNHLLRFIKTHHWPLPLCETIPNPDTRFLYDPFNYYPPISMSVFKTGLKT
jgi:hypothetical protein